jgi:hypothetical protein
MYNALIKKNKYIVKNGICLTLTIFLVLANVENLIENKNDNLKFSSV